jgi:hypothetical protein
MEGARSGVRGAGREPGCVTGDVWRRVGVGQRVGGGQREVDRGRMDKKEREGKGKKENRKINKNIKKRGIKDT